MAVNAASARRLLPLAIVLLLAIIAIVDAKPAALYYKGWTKRSPISSCLGSTETTRSTGTSTALPTMHTHALGRRAVTTVHLTSTIATVTKTQTKTIHKGTKTRHHRHHKHKHTRHGHHASKPLHAQKTRYAKDAAAHAVPTPAHKPQKRDASFADEDANGNTAASDEELNAVFLTAAAKDDVVIEAGPFAAAHVSPSFTATAASRPL